MKQKYRSYHTLPVLSLRNLCWLHLHIFQCVSQKAVNISFVSSLLFLRCPGVSITDAECAVVPALFFNAVCGSGHASEEQGADCRSGLEKYWLT